MRRLLATLVLVQLVATFALSAGAPRCACCAPSLTPTISTAQQCCPSGDSSRCISNAVPPSSLWLSLATAFQARPIILPDDAVPQLGPIDSLELEAVAARPSGREGLAMRSILRI